MNSQHIYIGIDDTDNPESRGTGFRARKMASLINHNTLGLVNSITRHQLFIHPQIPYTSQNSAACLEVYTNHIQNIITFCKTFLIQDSADGADVGLCIAKSNLIDDKIIQYGNTAKRQVVNQCHAKELAYKRKIFLEGLTGTQDGIIGALAAVGLRANGKDGRFIWLRSTSLRDLKGIMTAKELYERTKIDMITNSQGNAIPMSDTLFLGDWVRPVLKNHKKTIIVEKPENTNEYDWKVADKEYIKSISS